MHACVALSRSPDQPVAVCREDQRPRAHAGNATREREREREERRDREREREQRERERERALSDWARLVLRLLRVAGIKWDVQRGQVTVPFPLPDPDPDPDLTLSGRAGRPPQLTEQASLIMHGTYTTVKRGQGTTNLIGPQI